MKQTKNSMSVALLCSAALCGGAVFAQDTGAPQTPDKAAAAGKPSEAEMMTAMLELAKPGDNHKMLQDSVGSWSYRSKFWMNPDSNAPPIESTGTSTTKSTMGDRYFISEHKGKMPMPGADGKMQDMDFMGMSLEGYDNVKKEFVASWIDNMGTGIINFEGTFDAAAKKLTYTGEEEPMPGMKTKVREVFTYSDKDHHLMEYFEDQGGKFVKVMEINYTRMGSPPLRADKVQPTDAK